MPVYNDPVVRKAPSSMGSGTASKTPMVVRPARTTTSAPPRKATGPKHLTFADGNLKKVVIVPRDQDDPVEIWNVYSHVAYITRKEQRFLQQCVRTRMRECLDRYPSLFPDPPAAPASDKGSAKAPATRRLEGRLIDFLKEQGYGKNVASCAVYVMSVWPSFPVSQRPPLSPRVEMSMEALQRGTRVYVFNEKPNSPLKCGAALRMLRSVDADEASIAIFNPEVRSVIDGYIPLSFVVSQTFGLEPVEKERHLKKTGKIVCADGERRFLESPKRAFTAHCAAPEKFYVTFIAANQDDFDNWTRVIDYFVLLNACCRTYMQSR